MAPKFTQRHYNAVADLFWIRRQELRSFGHLTQIHAGRMNEWGEMQKRFRNLFAGDSVRFKPDKFDRACGLDS